MTLRRAYLASTYHVAGLALRIGRRSAAVDAVLAALGAFSLLSRHRQLKTRS